MAIYDHDDYWNPLLADIRLVRGGLKIHVPYITPPGMKRWAPTLSELVQNGKTVCVVLQQPFNWHKFVRGLLSKDDASEPQQFQLLVDRLKNLGAHVELRQKIHAKLLIIDEHILWEGSLNFLSHHDTTEHVRRSINRQEVMEVRQRHKLNDCQSCAKAENGDNGRLTDLIVKRREALGISQKDLARTVKSQLSELSRLESGKVPVLCALFIRVLDALNLRILVVPAYLCSATEHFINNAMEEAAIAKPHTCKPK